MQVKFISTIQPIQMTPTKVINSISLNMQVIRIIQESIISNVTSTSTMAIYLCFPSIFLCECCHAIILIFLLSNFTLNLRNPAGTRRVSPSFVYNSPRTTCPLMEPKVKKIVHTYTTPYFPTDKVKYLFFSRTCRRTAHQYIKKKEGGEIPGVLQI